MCLEDFVELTEVSIHRRIYNYQNARYICATVSAVLAFVFKYNRSAWNKVRQAMQTCNFCLNTRELLTACCSPPHFMVLRVLCDHGASVCRWLSIVISFCGGFSRRTWFLATSLIQATYLYIAVFPLCAAFFTRRLVLICIAYVVPVVFLPACCKTAMAFAISCLHSELSSQPS